MNFNAMYSAADKPTLVLMAGLPGAGKTTLALVLGNRLRWPVIDKDTLKSDLLLAEIQDKPASVAAYDLMFALGHDLLLQQGFSVILDSPALYSSIVDRAALLAQQAEARFKVILCLAASAVRNKRLKQRKARISQLRTDVFISEEEERRRFRHLPPETLVLNTVRPLEEYLPQALSFLSSVEPQDLSGNVGLCQPEASMLNWP